jgi:hypothetical protein
MNKEDGSVVVLVNKEEERICYSAVRSIDPKRACCLLARIV